MSLLGSMPYLVLGLVLFLSLLIVGYFGAVFWFAHNNPKIAAAEGTETVELAKLEQAAKNSKLLEGEYSVSANTAHPKAIGSISK